MKKSTPMAAKRSAPKKAAPKKAAPKTDEMVEGYRRGGFMPTSLRASRPVGRSTSMAPRHHPRLARVAPYRDMNRTTPFRSRGIAAGGAVAAKKGGKK